MPELKPPRFLFVSMVLFLSVETPVAAEPIVERPSRAESADVNRVSHERREPAVPREGLRPSGQLLSAQ